MITKIFTATISKVDGPLFSGTAHSMTLPAVEGEMTILANHEPLISMLKKGTITVRDSEGEKTFSIEKGLLETSNGQVTVLV